MGTTKGDADMPLGNRNAMATLGVKSLPAAKKFYEGTLGLKQLDPVEGGALAYKTGGAPLFVYESQFAGTNKATAVSWTVGNDLEDQVRELKGKGVTFEHYDMPNITREGDIHTSGGTKAAWFKDPDGNIHALTSR
jgi:catechol 2,3-dioxygenase-like lactoylglutathione lyase family enzyme